MCLVVVGPSELLQVVPELLQQVKPDLVFYVAGVDVYAGDRLGALNLSERGVWERDYFCLRQCAERNIPVACLIGGGYDTDKDALAARHAIVHR